MRSSILDPVRGIRSAVLALLAVSSLAGCRAARTEVVLGLATDLDAPAEIDRVRLFVQRNGVELARQDWDLSGVPGVPVALPGSYGLYTDGATPHVEVALIGMRKQVEVLRRVATFTPVRGETTFMRLTLARSCLGVMCGDGQTCVEGRCAATEMEGGSFPGYEPGMESALACASGTTFRDTSTRAPMPLSTPGTCAAGEHCSEGTCYKGVVDAGVAPDPKDLAMPADLAVADLATPDLAMPDLATPDIAMPAADLATPDIAMPAPDLATRDLAMPDLAMATPDLTTRDMAMVMPDLTTRDLAMPDLAVTQPMWRTYTKYTPDGGVGQVLAVGDANNDTFPEVFVNSAARTQVLLYKNVGGVLQGPVPVATGTAFTAITTGELDGDGKLDLVASDDPKTGLAVLKGDGNLLFRPPVYLPENAMADLVVADLNADGKLDIAGGSNTATIFSWTNTGNLQFTQHTANAPSQPNVFALGRFDQNVLGAILALGSANSAVMMPVTMAGGFMNGKTSVTSISPRRMAVADLDGDKRLDLVVTDEQKKLVILKGNGDGSFTETGSYAVPGASELAVLDYNRDGYPDLVLTDVGMGLLYTYVGRPGGLDLSNNPHALALSGAARALVVADLDGNGGPDIVVTTLTDEVNVILNRYP